MTRPSVAGIITRGNHRAGTVLRLVARHTCDEIRRQQVMKQMAWTENVLNVNRRAEGDQVLNMNPVLRGGGSDGHVAAV